MRDAGTERARSATDVDLTSLRLLVLVDQLGGISAAARARGISQPSASHRIRTLERRLGLELLDRRTGGAVLTDHGRLVADWARTVVEAADALRTGAQALVVDRAGQLSVGASQTVAEYLVPTWLAEYRRRHPGRPVRLAVANSAGVVAALRARDVDLGFVEGPTVPRDIASRRVGTDRLVPVVAPGHPLARRRRPVTVADLGRYPLVSREPGSGTRDTLRRALGEHVAAAPPAVTLDSNTAVKVLVEGGGYLAVLSRLAVAAELRDGRLVEVPLEGVDLSRVLHAVWRRAAARTGPRADFLDVVVGGRPRTGSAARPAGAPAV